MKLYHAISLLAVSAQASAARSPSFHSDLVGWNACPKDTFPASGGSGNQKAECAVYSAPLCYPGICQTPKHVDPTVDIFVKRLPAVSGPKTASNVWLLQDTPGLSSSMMESLMVAIHEGLNGTVNVYTMDQRGTGRSTSLDCFPAKPTAIGSPSGPDIEPLEVPACAKVLKKKFGDLSSFSIKSVAMDVSSFISDYSNGANTIMYTPSGGTTLMEHLMIHNPPEVTAYDSNFEEAGNAFLALCAKTSNCSERFVPKNLPDTLQNLIAQFDKNPKSTCAALVSKLFSDQSSQKEPASYMLRRVLGDLLLDADMRTLIPAVVYRLNHCEAKDIDVLTKLFTTLTDAPQSPPSDNRAFSPLLYYLITFSEMWETPVPSISEMTSRLTNQRMSSGSAYSMVPLYCAFSKEKSAVCDELGVGNYDGSVIIYEAHKCWNTRITIPPQASVLLLSGKLDPAAPHKFAKFLMETLDGAKELITFKHSTHLTVSGSSSGELTRPCGLQILLSYITNDGDLKRLDKSCVAKMPAFKMTPLLDFQCELLGTDDLYDGDYKKSLSTGAATTPSSSSSSHPEYQG